MIKCDTHEINLDADVSCKAGGLKIGMGLHLHPYFVYASRESFGSLRIYFADSHEPLYIYCIPRPK